MIVLDSLGKVKSNCNPLTESEFNKSKLIFLVVPLDSAASLSWTVFLELTEADIFKVSDFNPESWVTIILDLYKLSELETNKSKLISCSWSFSISIGTSSEMKRLGSNEENSEIVNFIVPSFLIVNLWDLVVFLRTSPKLKFSSGTNWSFAAFKIIPPFSVLEVTSTKPELVKTGLVILIW